MYIDRIRQKNGHNKQVITNKIFFLSYLRLWIRTENYLLQVWKWLNCEQFFFESLNLAEKENKKMKKSDIDKSSFSLQIYTLNWFHLIVYFYIFFYWTILSFSFFISTFFLITYKHNLTICFSFFHTSISFSHFNCHYCLFCLFYFLVPLFYFPIWLISLFPSFFTWKWEPFLRESTGWGVGVIQKAGLQCFNGYLTRTPVLIFAPFSARQKLGLQFFDYKSTPFFRCVTN